jgi:hypothetical protein
VTVGKTSSQMASLLNSGGAKITISKASVIGRGFNVTGLPLTLAGGQSASFTVSFTPTTAGSVTGAITLVSNFTNSLTKISLSGAGVTASVAAKPSSTDFGDVVLGDKSILPIEIDNTGTASVTISQGAVTGAGFSISGLLLPLVLSVGQNSGFNITFAPTLAGSVTGSVSIVSNASNSPLTAPLSGTGVHAVDLSWIASSSTSVPGYNAYRASVSGGPYAQLNSTPVTGTSYRDASVQPGQRYYYVITAVNADHSESSYSNQVQVEVPSP